MTLTTINLTALGQTVNLGTEVTGTLPVANGGTALTSGTTGQFLKFTGTTTVASAAVATIDVADQWYLNAATSAGTNGIVGDSGEAGSTWVKYNNMFSDTMTVTTGSGGGKFTFPKTGVYQVMLSAESYHNTDDNDMGIAFEVTTNNFSGSSVRGWMRSTFNDTDGTPNAYHQTTGSTLIDVTDTANVKFRIKLTSVATNNYLYGANGTGGDGYNTTHIVVLRLGDT
tara:strand:- start:379 stop:1059 length:681 start_codon:yes stop_codon:yes gene_type:complete